MAHREKKYTLPLRGPLLSYFLQPSSHFISAYRRAGSCRLTLLLIKNPEKRGFAFDPGTQKEITINSTQILIGLAGLSAGVMLYLINRPPDSAYLIRLTGIEATLYGRIPNVFGPIGGSLPGFLHVFSFILLTSGLLYLRDVCYHNYCSACDNHYTDRYHYYHNYHHNYYPASGLQAAPVMTRVLHSRLLNMTGTLDGSIAVLLLPADPLWGKWRVTRMRP